MGITYRDKSTKIVGFGGSILCLENHFMTDACDEGIITYMDSVDYGKCIKVNLNKTTNTDSDTSWEMVGSNIIYVFKLEDGWLRLQMQISGQTIIFHQPSFPEIRRFPLPKPPFGGENSCEVES